MATSSATLRILWKAFAGGPLLFGAVAAVIAVTSTPPISPEPVNDAVYTLAGICFAFTGFSFLLANRLATLFAERQPADNRIASWILINMAIREGAALLGCTVFFIASQDGAVLAHPWLWTLLLPVLLFLAFSVAQYPSDDRIADISRQLTE
jgi:hypothetical protein